MNTKIEKTKTAGEEIHEATGVLRCHRRGFGFLSQIESEYAFGEDLFIKPGLLPGVLDGDHCVARVIVKDGEFEVIGLRSVKQVRERIIGEGNGERSLQLDPGVGVGEVEVDRICKRGRTYLAVWRDGGWRVVQDLGESHTDGALYERCMERYLLQSGPDERAEREAGQIAQAGRGGRTENRRDLTDQLVITIDADHSKDLDDALSARIEKDGSVRVWVHIADVAEYVVEGSSLDLAAARIPTSVYLPMQVRPMLPEVLSEERLSLLPGVERDALTVELVVAANGKIISREVYESRIKSATRLSYTTVARHIRGEKAVIGEIGRDVSDLVGWLWHAASRIGVQRRRRGGVEGGLLGERHEEDLDKDAHLLVERLMVAANENVAEWLETKGMPALYRCHTAPGEEALVEIEATARAFGYNVSFERPVSPIAFAAFCEQISRSKHAEALWDVVGAAMERASYQTENLGHFGLGSEKYLHFTSPLRRYADLLVHRVVKGVLRGEQNREGWLYTLQSHEQHITEISERAGWAERDARVAVALRGMLNQTKRRGLGVVRGLNQSQVRIYVKELGEVTGSVNVRRLPSRYEYDQVRRELVSKDGRIELGDEVSVQARRIDPISGSLELKIVGKAKRGKNGSTKAGSKQNAGGAQGKGAGKNAAGSGKSKKRRGSRGGARQRARKQGPEQARS